MGYTLAVPPGAQSVPMASYPAAPSVVQLPQQQAATNPATGKGEGTDWKGTAYTIGENVAWMAGKGSLVAAPVAAAFSMAGAGHKARKSLQDVINDYRDVISQRMGVAPDAVDENVLRALVEEHGEAFPAIAQAVQVIDKERGNRPWLSVASGMAGVGGFTAGTTVAGAFTAGAAATSWAGPLALVAGGAAALAASYGAEKAGGAILGTADLNESAHAALKGMNEKLARGEAVTPFEVFTLFARMDDGFRESFKERTEIDLLRVDPNNPEEMQCVTLEISRHEGKLAQASQQLAYLLSTGQMAPTQLAGMNPRQLIGQEQVMIADGQPQVAGPVTDTAQPGPGKQAVGPRTAHILAQRAANDTGVIQPGRTA
jgi:hypothetical protein